MFESARSSQGALAALLLVVSVLSTPTLHFLSRESHSGSRGWRGIRYRYFIGATGPRPLPPERVTSYLIMLHNSHKKMWWRVVAVYFDTMVIVIASSGEVDVNTIKSRIELQSIRTTAALMVDFMAGALGLRQVSPISQADA